MNYDKIEEAPSSSKKNNGILVPLIFILATIAFFILMSGENTKKTEMKVNNNQDTESNDFTNATKKCLVGFDWVYPNSSNIRSAWMFSSDGTFNFSTEMFGGMSAWGQWEVIGPDKIKVRYTKNTQGTFQNDQELTLSGCNSLIVGTTIYTKD
jgi:hypothetical protein